MPVRHFKSASDDRTGRSRGRDKMETIWLQRSSLDMPWGFRIAGGREFGLPLTVQRVTPGSVAAAALGPGDVILKVGNVMATHLEHSDAQELVRQSGNILQMTIKKPDGPVNFGPSTECQSQLIVETDDHNVSKGFGTGIPLNNNNNHSPSPNYATIPRNFGSQHQPPQHQLPQRVIPTLQRSEFNTNSFEDESPDNNGYPFPDYTLPYKKQDIVHDSPGGPDNIRGFVLQSENTGYSTNSLPHSFVKYTNDTDEGYGALLSYEPKSQNDSHNSSNSSISVETKFSIGVPFQASPNTQQSFHTINTQPFQPANNTVQQPALTSSPRPFSPATYSGPTSPRNEPNSGYGSMEQNASYPEPFIQSGNSCFDNSNIHGSGNNTYSTLPHPKPSYITNNNNKSLNIYKSSPQPYSAPKSYTTAQFTTSSLLNQTPAPFVPTQFSAPFAPTQTSAPFAPTETSAPLAPTETSAPFVPTQSPAPFVPTQSPAPFVPPQAASSQSQVPPGSSSGFSAPYQVIRKVSFDKNSEETSSFAPPSTFSARPYKPVQAPGLVGYSKPVYSQNEEANKVKDVVLNQMIQLDNISQVSQTPDDVYTAVPYLPPARPVSPRADLGGGYSIQRYNTSDLAEGVNTLNLGSTRYEPQASESFPPPPPPLPQVLSSPLPQSLPPPPAPPLNEWNPSPYRRPSNNQLKEETEEQKIPDQLLSTMMQSAKSGGPKPFSYGLNLTELQKKIGPPTAPKPKPGKVSTEDGDQEQDNIRQYNGAPRKSAGHIQSDYFIKRDDDTSQGSKTSKKPAGQIQSDYLPSRITGPRSEVDESPININMGSNPKKQSKSFKVLQWMTETENDETEEPTQKPRKTKDPERRHNADDDEMRFSGLNSKAEIPSKTFGILQRISSNDDSLVPQQHNGKATLDVGDSEEVVGSFEEIYKGRNIPSPSFRMLQSWAESDPEPTTVNSTTFRRRESNDALADTINNDVVVEKHYKGANIPSKVFKALQKSLDDLSPPLLNNGEMESNQMSDIVPPISEF